METPTPPVPPPEYKDCSSGLLILGIAEMLLGALCGLLIAFMLLGQVMLAKTGRGEANYRAMLPAAVMYGFGMVVFISLGIGSLKARRWARALNLILGWFWLVSGVLGGFTLFTTLPMMKQTLASTRGQVPPAFFGFIVLFTVGFYAVFFVALPAALVFFCRNKQVRATCDRRDPVERWTDRRPLPVLALSLLLVLGAVMTLGTSAGYGGFYPFAGRLLTGLPGLATAGVAAILFSMAAWLAYRQKKVGWWLAVVLYAMTGYSGVTTFSSVEPAQMYRAMGMSDAQLAQLQQYGSTSGVNMVMWALIGSVPLLVYLIIVKKYYCTCAMKPANGGVSLDATSE